MTVIDLSLKAAVKLMKKITENDQHYRSSLELLFIIKHKHKYKYKSTTTTTKAQAQEQAHTHLNVICEFAR